MDEQDQQDDGRIFNKWLEKVKEMNIKALSYDRKNQRCFAYLI